MQEKEPTSANEAPDLAALVREFLEDRKAQGLSPKSVMTYERVLGRLIERCPGLPVSSSEVEAVIDQGVWSPSTQRVMRVCIGSFFTSLERRYGMINPCKT